MIFHEDCALNIEHTLFKGGDVIVIGWIKGDAGMALVHGNTTLPSNVIRSERPDVADYFGIKKNECFGFALYSSQARTNARAEVALRLLDKKSSLSKDVPLTESEDYTDGLRVVDGLKARGLPDDFFQEGILIEGIKYKIGGQVDRRTAVGHIEVVKLAKGGKDAVIVGWAVSKTPNNLVLKIGDTFVPYENLFAYPRPDIEEAFVKLYGQNARNGGFIGFTSDSNAKSSMIQLYFCRRVTRTLQLVASTDQIERDMSYEDIQGYLRGIYSPDLTLAERVKKVDGPLARSAFSSVEETAHFMRADILIASRNLNTNAAQIAVIVPKGFVGDVLQCVMSFVALKTETQSLSIHFFYCDVINDCNQLRDVADRAHALFDCEVQVYNGCTTLTLGHIGYAMSRAQITPCYVIDARSGFEYQYAIQSSATFNIVPKEVRLFYARDINGISRTGVTFELLNQFVPSSIQVSVKRKAVFSRNKVFAIALQGKTLGNLAQDMGFVSLNELTDIELLIRRSDQLTAKYQLQHEENGLPFARTVKTSQSFQEVLARQVEIFSMAQVGI